MRVHMELLKLLSIEGKLGKYGVRGEGGLSLYIHFYTSWILNLLPIQKYLDYTSKHGTCILDVAVYHTIQYTKILGK